MTKSWVIWNNQVVLGFPFLGRRVVEKVVLNGYLTNESVNCKPKACRGWGLSSWKWNFVLYPAWFSFITNLDIRFKENGGGWVGGQVRLSMKSLVSIPSRGTTHAREWIRKERVAIYISIMSLAESHVLSLGFGQYLSVRLAPGTESSHILYSWASGIYQWSETQGHTNRRAKVLGQSLCVIWQVLNPWRWLDIFHVWLIYIHHYSIHTTNPQNRYVSIHVLYTLLDIAFWLCCLCFGAYSTVYAVESVQLLSLYNYFAWHIILN